MLAPTGSSSGLPYHFSIKLDKDQSHAVMRLGPVLLTISALSPSHQRCWLGDPTFTGPPEIEQIFPHTVKLTWDKVLDRPECADWMVVEWWRRSTIFF